MRQDSFASQGHHLEFKDPALFETPASITLSVQPNAASTSQHRFLPAEADHGFHGRSHELLLLERLLQQRGHATIVGLGGTLSQYTHLLEYKARSPGIYPSDQRWWLSWLLFPVLKMALDTLALDPPSQKFSFPNSWFPKFLVS